MNVALITHYIPSYRSSFLKGLSLSHNIKLELYADHNNSYFNNFDFINGDEFNFFTSKVKILTIFKKAFFFQLHIIDLILNPKYDIIILTASKSDVTVWLGLILGKCVKKKIILWGHFKSDKIVEKVVNYLFLNISYSNIFYSEKERLNYSSLIINKSFVAKNTMVVNSTSTLNNTTNNNIIFSGRFTKGKKLDVLLKALSIVKLKFTFRLMLIGDGPEKKRIVNLSEELNLMSNVSFEGAIFDSTILNNLYKKSLFSVIPSHAGLAIHHAFAHGKIVITDNDINEHPPEFDVLKNKVNAFIYESYNHFELAELISFCFENKYDIIKMGLRAKKDFESEFSVNKMIDGFVKAINFKK